MYNDYMKIKIVKLDKRHTGNKHFKYMVVIGDMYSKKVDMIDNFRQLREWSWTTFGPSCEYNEYTILSGYDRDVNPRWSWMDKQEFRAARILLNNDEDRNWFALRWCSE